MVGCLHADGKRDCLGRRYRTVKPLKLSIRTPGSQMYHRFSGSACTVAACRRSAAVLAEVDVTGAHRRGAVAEVPGRCTTFTAQGEV